MNGYFCFECDWVGLEPEKRIVRGWEAAGEPYNVIHESCPECGHDELQEANVCESCASAEVDDGFDNCRECLIEVDEAIAAGEYRRDTVEKIEPLMRKQS